MTDIPIIRLGHALISTLPQDLSDVDALSFREALTDKIEATGASGILLDISSLEIVDSFFGRVLNEIELRQGCSARGRS
jgi:rsbT antagonist protein RsbS